SVREVLPALEFPELRDYRGVVNCRLAGSGLDQTALAEIARTAQIDFIFLGDYAKPNTVDFGLPGFTASVLFFPRASYTMGGGEIVALNLVSPVDPGGTTNDLIRKIHDRGGLAMAANISGFSSPDDYALADAIEIYNQNRVWNAQTGMYMRAIFSN